MPDIRIKDLPLATGITSPVASDVVAIDGDTTRKAPLSALGSVIRPFSTQAQAEAGTDNTTTMTPLTTAQAIAAQAASQAQGTLASSSLQPEDIGVSVQAHSAVLDSFNTAQSARNYLSYTNGFNANGVTDDTANFSNLEMSTTGQEIDLGNKSFAVSAIPSGNVYSNGFWVVSAVTYNSVLNNLSIGSASNTGVMGTPYSGGVLNYVRVAGRSNTWTVANIASSNCYAEFARAINVSSINSRAIGNVSINLAARQSAADTPQSTNIASEECAVWGGFGGANISSAFSTSNNERGTNIAVRYSGAAGRCSANIASNNAETGRGTGGKIVGTITGGAVTALAVDSGISGKNYTVGDTIEAYDRSGAGTGFVATVASVGAGGSLATFNITNGGSGFSNRVDFTVNNSTGAFSANVAADTSQAWGTNSGNFAATGSRASGPRSVNIGGQDNIASGDTSATIASAGSQASALISAAIATTNSLVSAQEAIVFGRRTQNNTLRTLAGGDSSSGAASTANRKWEISNATGAVRIAGTLSQSQIFTDIAKMFENVSGEIPVGSLVAWEGRKVRLAEAGDDEFSVHSRTYSILLGDSAFSWSQRYVTDEFGEQIMEQVWDEDEQKFVMYPKENPDFDPDAENVPRSERREEWTPVALIGEAHVRVDDSVSVGDYVCPESAGKGCKSQHPTRVRCMEIRQPYSDEKGYAVALCLIRG